MNCIFCNSPVPDDGVFCPTCGKRIDGKKPCPACGKYFEGIFCPYCGTRTDGKIECANCHKVFEGIYCPYCGTPAKEDNKTATQTPNKPKTNKKFFDGYLKVERFLSPALLLGALFILFVCSFFIGVTTISVYLGQTTTQEYGNIFPFFCDFYKELADTSNLLKQSTTNITPEQIDFSLYAPTILCTIALSVNLLASFVCLVLGCVKFYKFVKYGESISINKYISFSLSTFFIAVATMYAYSSYFFSAGSGTTLSFTILSPGSIAGIVCSSVFVLIGIALKQVSFGKKALQANNLFKLISHSLFVALIIAIVSVSNNFFLSATAQSSSGSTEHGQGSLFFALTRFVFMDSPSLSANKTYFTLVLSLISFTAILILTAAILYHTIKGFFYLNRSSSSIKLILGWTIATTICVILYFIFGLISIINLEGVFAYNSSASSYNLSKVGVIVPFVLSILLLATSIFYHRFASKNNPNVKNDLPDNSYLYLL